MMGDRPPASAGFRMPAEWEPHAATWLSWPHNPETWPGKMEAVPRIWAKLAAELSSVESVHILVDPRSSTDRVRDLLTSEGAGLDRVALYEVATNDAWMRDHGPTFVVRDRDGERETMLIDWSYNAWGGKYPPWDADDLVPSRLQEILGMPLYSPGVVLEGGSIDVNGSGTVLTTESCLLNPNRNPTYAREQIEEVLRATLGLSHCIWLGDGIVGDDTDGHIDDVTRFVGPRSVVTAIEHDRGDANFEPLRANVQRLERAVDEEGRSLEIHTLPMPPALYDDGHRLPASYANFYIANSLVVVPVFGCDRDDAALQCLAALFPGRRIVGIEAVDLVAGLGAFHCITQQQPA